MPYLKKNVVVNMPQMAIEALSENYLFKEIGDCHWEMICKGLNTASYDLKNDTGDRLYATFVRIRIRSEKSIKSFKENQNVEIEGKLTRFGESMFFSEIDFQSETGRVKGELMTTFSIRDKVDNTKLSKAEPDVEVNEVPKLDAFPGFGNDYRLVKKGVQKEVGIDNLKFEIGDGEPIFSTRYRLNPFYDINGVNLLYFAAYPIINDYCEAEYFNASYDGNWEQDHYTLYKDVFYYANCNLDDSLTYELYSSEKIDEHTYKNNSILRRNSDNAIIARVFSVKGQSKA